MGYHTTRRHNTEILLEILKATMKPLPQTRVMQDCNLSWIPTKKMVEFLVEKGLLKQIPPPETSTRKGTRGRKNKGTYVTTGKGVRLLEQVKGSLLGELFEYGKGAEV